MIPMQFTISLLVCLFSTVTFAESTLQATKNALAASKEMVQWFETNSEALINCTPTYSDGDYVLCDGTRVSKSELKQLFQMKPTQLLAFVKSKGIKVEILCKEAMVNPFKKWCKTTGDRKFFKDVSSLHGQFVPNENVIVLHSDAYVGSMVHEYLHYLQFVNKNKKHGRVYKSERIKVQNLIDRAMVKIIAEVQRLESDGKRQKAVEYIPQFKELTARMMRFASWQKLIDERNLFRLYILYGKDFGAAEDDVQLAKKNIGFLCADASVSTFMPRNECKLAQ